MRGVDEGSRWENEMDADMYMCTRTVCSRSLHCSHSHVSRACSVAVDMPRHDWWNERLHGPSQSTKRSFSSSRSSWSHAPQI